MQVSEALWALCDWCLKMVATSSLMEANFLTLNQRRDSMLSIKEAGLRMQSIRELSIIMARKGVHGPAPRFANATTFVDS